MKKLKKDNKGFSLVELLVVIAIMVVLVGVVAPSLLSNIEKSRESKDVQNLDSIASALQSAITDEDAHDDMPNNDGTPVAFSTVFAKTGGAYTKNDDFYKKVREYLPSGESIKLSSKTAKTGEIYFKIKDDSITVYVSTDGAAPVSDKFSLTR